MATVFESVGVTETAFIIVFLYENFVFVIGATTPPPTGPWSSHSWGFYITHNDAPQSVGLLWTSDQLVAETSTWQHTQHSQQRDIRAPGGIRTHNLSRRAVVDLRLRPRGHWDRPYMIMIEDYLKCGMILNTISLWKSVNSVCGEDLRLEIHFCAIENKPEKKVLGPCSVTNPDALPEIRMSYTVLHFPSPSNVPGSSVDIATDYGNDGLGSNPSGDEIFLPTRPAPGAHPDSCTMGTGSFPRVKCGRGVLLTTHHLLVPWSWKSRVIPLPTLWTTPGL